MDTTLLDLEVRTGLEKLRKLELLGVIKHLNDDASEIEKSLIRKTVQEAELSVAFDLNLDLEDRKGSIHKICEYLKIDTVAWSTPEEIFSFNCKTIAVAEFTEELEGLHEDIADYTISIGNKTMFYVNRAWHEGSAQFKKSNLNQNTSQDQTKLPRRLPTSWPRATFHLPIASRREY